MSTTIRTAAVTLAAGLALLLASASPADAKARKRFRTDKEFGIGLMVGAPSGLAAKLYLDAPLAIQFGLGSSHYGHHYNDRRHYHNHGVHFHADVLWHPVVLARSRSLQLPLYIGVGGQINNHGYDDRDDDHSHIGARVPFGLALDFNRVPLDVFFELAFALDFGHDSHSYLTGSLGARYYF